MMKIFIDNVEVVNVNSYNTIRIEVDDNDIEMDREVFEWLMTDAELPNE